MFHGTSPYWASKIQEEHESLPCQDLGRRLGIQINKFFGANMSVDADLLFNPHPASNTL
jgi:hypothetical protein